MGKPKNIPSNLSITPPCPGKIFPVSLIFTFRFKKEKNKSPIWQPNDVQILTNKTSMFKTLKK